MPVPPVRVVNAWKGAWLHRPDIGYVGPGVGLFTSMQWLYFSSFHFLTPSRSIASASPLPLTL